MIEVTHVSKYFYKPYREPGIKGMLKTLFTRLKIETKAVDDICFRVGEGEIVGYIGANGAGKSTTIKMMSGILTPTKGEILIDGYKPYDARERKKVLNELGVVFGQRTQLWWDLPLVETFTLYRDIYGIPEDVYKTRLAYLCQVLDIDKFMNSQVRTLSLGQRMRADLAASLIHNPKVLFLDEPTIGLDVLVKDKMTAAIKDINRQFNTTVILTTHDMKDITNLCSRIIILDEGHIIYDGTISDLKKRFGDIRHVYVLSKTELDQVAMNSAFAGRLSFEKEDTGYLAVSYDADKVATADVIGYLLKNLPVSDIKLSETSLSKVVKKIYETKTV
jgi:ABC-2 type transport system ATP-binding protein